MKIFRIGTSKIVSLASILILIASLLSFVVFKISGPRKYDENLPKTSSQESRKIRKADLGKRAPNENVVSAILESTQKLTGKQREELRHSLLNPEQAQALLSKVDITNINERGMLSRIVFEALCKSGYSAEAWELVDANAGSVRETQLGTMFAFSKEPVGTLLAHFKQLTEPNERTVAIHGIISNEYDLINFDYRKLELESAADKNALGQALSVKISGTMGSGSSDPDRSRLLLEKSISLVKEGILDAGQLDAILVRDQSFDVYDKWKLLDGVQGSVKPNELEAIQSKLVPYMIESDMARALELITTEQSTKYSVPVLTRAIKRAYSIDPAQSNAWVLNNLATIDPATGQRLIFGIGQVAIANNELQTAQQWADRLLNPGVKQQLLEQIKAAQPQQAK
jgi:hypothetical protein